MSGRVDLPASGAPAANEVPVFGEARLPPLRVPAGIPLAPQSSVQSCSPCSGCFAAIGTLLLRGFRAFIGAIVTCLIDCCSWCFPARAPHPRAARYSPEAQRVADYIVLANPRADREELNRAYAALPPQVHPHISQAVLGSPRHRAEIERLMEIYRREERKGPPPTDAELRARAVSEFIGNFPRDPLILETLQALITPRN